MSRIQVSFERVVLVKEKEDIKTTNRLVEAGKIMGIEILDHIIVSDDRYVSLKERGMM